MEEPELPTEEIVKLFDRQNAGLAAKEWVIVKGSENKDVKSAHSAVL